MDDRTDSPYDRMLREQQAKKEPTASELAEQMETNALRSYARRLFQVNLLLDTAARDMERLPVTGRQGMLVQLAAELIKGVEDALKQAADRRE